MFGESHHQADTFRRAEILCATAWKKSVNRHTVEVLFVYIQQTIILESLVENDRERIHTGLSGFQTDRNNP